MKTIKQLFVLAVISSFVACAASGPLENTRALVTTNEIGKKKGVAEMVTWFGIPFGNTDIGIAAAAKKGKIIKVATVDTEVTSSFLGFKLTYRTIVTGERDPEAEAKDKAKKSRRRRK